MSYHKYSFVSPDPVFAQVKEELRSYFQTGIVDDIMFPVYAQYILDKFGNGTMPILDTTIKLHDYSTRLPEDFIKVRELYLCHHVSPVEVKSPGAIYCQQRILPPNCENPPERKLQVIKTTVSTTAIVAISHLLKPGNISTRDSCDDNCKNLWVQSGDTFDIRDGFIHTNFPTGTLYLVYFSQQLDLGCAPLIPDVAEFREYLRSYLVYKCFETIFNNTTDETFRQIESKLSFYKSAMEENFIIAKTEFMKKTSYQAIDAIKKQAGMFNKYEIR